MILSKSVETIIGYSCFFKNVWCCLSGICKWVCTIEVSIDELFVCFDALKWIDIKGGNDDWNCFRLSI